MEQLETEHYIFYYNVNTRAAQDIPEIADFQESCFHHICKVLKTRPKFKIRYYLCDSPEQVGHLYGDNEPCNGFTAPPDTVYAVYNEQIQCIGYHEDAHIISYTINRPDTPAIREGLAMYFDRKWWDIPNLDWVLYYRNNGKYISIEALQNREIFFSSNCAISYPIMGAFTDYLISCYGIDTYLEFYRSKAPSWESSYGKTLSELENDFLAFSDQFSLHTTIEQQITQLLQDI